MNTEKGVCKKCGKEDWIVNRTRFLCEKCNKERLVENGTKTIKPVKTLLLSNKVWKASKHSNKKIEAYKVIDENREHICSGCGASKNLSHSHIIPVSRRKDLEGDIDNIVFDCMTVGSKVGCHDIWEHGTKEEKMSLNNYEERMNYIKKKDLVYYNLILNKHQNEKN